MRHTIQKLGRLNSVIIITAISFVLAIVFDFFIAYILDHKITFSEDLVRAGIIPLLIAPFLSWYLIGLLIELDNLEKATNKLATYDDLTGLLNRRAFLHSCEGIHNLAMRNKQSYCFFVIDLDFFKKVNDIHGHPCGDVVLANLGKLFTEVSRKSDVIARLGGEEFGFFLPDTNKDQATEFAKKLREKINEMEVVYEGKIIKVTVSIGIAINSYKENLLLDKVYKQADKALYSAKSNGRDQFVFYL